MSKRSENSDQKIAFIIMIVLVVTLTSLAIRFSGLNNVPEEFEDPLSRVVNEVSCVASGGNWNSCASACPPGTEACIEVCIEQCECSLSDQCPFGSRCILRNEVGVCETAF